MDKKQLLDFVDGMFTKEETVTDTDTAKSLEPKQEIKKTEESLNEPKEKAPAKEITDNDVTVDKSAVQDSYDNNTKVENMVAGLTQTAEQLVELLNYLTRTITNLSASFDSIEPAQISEKSLKQSVLLNANAMQELLKDYPTLETVKSLLEPKTEIIDNELNVDKAVKETPKKDDEDKKCDPNGKSTDDTKKSERTKSIEKTQEKPIGKSIQSTNDETKTNVEPNEKDIFQGIDKDNVIKNIDNMEADMLAVRSYLRKSNQSNTYKIQQELDHIYKSIKQAKSTKDVEAYKENYTRFKEIADKL